MSNSAHDTSLSHSSLERILASHQKFVLAIVGGRSRGFRNPPAGQLWSESVENVLKKTEQTLALKVPTTLCLRVHACAIIGWIADRRTVEKRRTPAERKALCTRGCQMRQCSYTGV